MKFKFNRIKYVLSALILLPTLASATIYNGPLSYYSTSTPASNSIMVYQGSPYKLKNTDVAINSDNITGIAALSTTGNITSTTGNLVLSGSGTGLVTTPVTASGVASGPVTCNGRVCVVTFTSVSIAAGATLALQVADSAITSSSTVVGYSWSGATTSSALSAQSAVSGTGTWTLTLTNGTGATTSVANVVAVITVLN